MIKKIYYTIWVDWIVLLKSACDNSSWKLWSMFFMTMTMGIQFGIFMVFLQKVILGVYFYYLNIDIFLGKNINAFFSGFMLFILPFLILNYFFIFRKKRYEELIKRYKYHNGKWAIRYSLGTFAILSLSMLILLLYLITKDYFGWTFYNP